MLPELLRVAVSIEGGALLPSDILRRVRISFESFSGLLPGSDRDPGETGSGTTVQRLLEAVMNFD
jgi:hypothetical protein